MSEKKQRGRPKKKDLIIPFISNNTETTTNDELINTTYNCTNDYHEENIILENDLIISNTPILENIKTEDKEKKRRGRPAKYNPEERKEKYQELNRSWYHEHKNELYSKKKEIYKENSKDIKEATMNYQNRARNAHRLLTELLEKQLIEFKDESYKKMAIDLINHKLIIYKNN